MKNKIITDCISHAEDYLKKAMDMSIPSDKSSSMIVELYHKVQLLQSQLNTEAGETKIDYKQKPYIAGFEPEK